MARYFLLTTSVAALFAAGSAAVANAQQSPMAPVAGRIEAPVGHRQPRAQDLPRDVLQNEGGRTEEQIKSDKDLNICRGC